MNKPTLYPLQLKPVIKNYVWGGHRLASFIPSLEEMDPELPVAEAWIIYEGDSVINGPLAGQQLADLVKEYGTELLGSQIPLYYANRFPLLIKILDCNAWLSVQVHPNDSQAQQLEGAQFIGKTEAWHVIENDPGAEVLAGVIPGITREKLTQSIRDGSIAGILQHHALHKNDTLMIPAGTVHASGPGTLIYEVQQSSDITYRIYDWSRPLTAGRKLHIEQAISVADPDIEVKPIPLPEIAQTNLHPLVMCPYFRLDFLELSGHPFHFDTAAKTFLSITALNGKLQFNWQNQIVNLDTLQTILVPAASGKFSLNGIGQALVAGLPVH